MCLTNQFVILYRWTPCYDSTSGDKGGLRLKSSITTSRLMSPTFKTILSSWIPTSYCTVKWYRRSRAFLLFLECADCKMLSRKGKKEVPVVNTSANQRWDSPTAVGAIYPVIYFEMKMQRIKNSEHLFNLMFVTWITMLVKKIYLCLCQRKY